MIINYLKTKIPILFFLTIFLLINVDTSFAISRLLDRAGKGTVMVFFINKKGAEDYLEYAENILKGKLKESNFKIMNPEITEKLKKDRLLWEAIKNANATAMVKISTEFGADILIRGNLSVESNERFAGSWEGMASLDITAIDTKTAEEIETLNSEPMGSTENPAPMEDSSLSAKQMAIKKAIDDILRKMGVSTDVVLTQLTTISPVFYTTFPSEAGEIQDIAFSPDNRLIAVACESAIKIWNIEERTLARTIIAMKEYNGKATSLTFNKEGNILAATTSSGDVYLWNMQGGDTKKISRAHSSGAWAIDFSPDSRILATGGGDGIIRMWEASTGTKIGEMGRHQKRIHSIAFDNNGRNVITVSDDLTIRYWDINTKKETRAFNEPMDRLLTAAFSPDRSLIAYGAKTIEIDLMRNRREDKEYVRLRDAISGRDIFTFEGHIKDITSISFLPGKRFIVSSSLDKTIKIWDVEKRGEVTSLEQNDYIYAIDTSKDGKWLAAGGRDRAVTVWRLK